MDPSNFLSEKQRVASLYSVLTSLVKLWENVSIKGLGSATTRNCPSDENRTDRTAPMLPFRTETGVERLRRSHTLQKLTLTGQGKRKLTISYSSRFLSPPLLSSASTSSAKSDMSPSSAIYPQLITSSFDVEEIKSSIWDCGSEKAPDLDANYNHYERFGGSRSRSFEMNNGLGDIGNWESSRMLVQVRTIIKFENGGTNLDRYKSHIYLSLNVT
ncbi:hypothetical protein LXL04_033211 [Taraxacum kok-saghyz]